MAKKCVLCYNGITEEYGKLDGTIVKAKGEDNKNQFIYVCSNCQKEKEWLEKAKIKAV